LVDLNDKNNSAIPGYSVKGAIPFRGDSTLQQIKWKGNEELPLGCSNKICFNLHNGALYSFWMPDSEAGKSGGYLAVSNGLLLRYRQIDATQR